MDLGLHNATVLVTGGTKGMGRAAAECFAGEGARIAVLGRGLEALDETMQALEARGAQEAVPVQADLTSATELDDAFSSLRDRWQSLNVLVNAAGPVDVGIGRFDSIDD